MMIAEEYLEDTSFDVSVVIPCFDGEPEHIRQAVSSAIGPRTEVILVDDGSTRQDTRDAIDQLEITVIRTPNRGVAAALNEGIRAASGRYLISLGSDDILGAGYVRGLAEFLDQHPHVAIACTGWKEFEQRDRHITPPPTTSAEEMAGACTILASAMFRRRDWTALGGYHETERGVLEDWEWWVRLLFATGSEARLVPGLTYHYRIKKESLNITNHQGVDVIAATRRVMLERNPGHEKAIAEGLLHDLAVAYELGQNQSPIAEAATEQARYWAGRYGKLEGALTLAAKTWTRIRKKSDFGS